MTAVFPRIASLKSAGAFRAHLTRERIPLDFDDVLARGDSPLAQPFELDGIRVGNRFCILPMEGWDGTRDGEPSELTERRWQRFGTSGAKLMWGGEAVAVRHDGRANPHQLLLTAATQPRIAALRETLVSAHRERFGSNADGDLFIGLQLTHSGRYAKPDTHDRPDPLAACRYEPLDRRFANGVRFLEDEDLDRLVDQFVNAARLAYDAGYQFVDVKHCHGYLGHELLASHGREGRYGGSLDNRMRFARTIVDGIRSTTPGLRVGVRLSAFDTIPYRRSASGLGVPEEDARSAGFGFGVVSDDNLAGALAEAHDVIRRLEAMGVHWICVTAGSPDDNPHIQRPAFFPPSDGYTPPEDPLRGVARQIQATAILKASFPKLAFVGSAYSYLQEWLPHVAQHAVANGLTDFVGLGRVALSYPDLPADVLAGLPLKRHAVCRTFSDCTTGPRIGVVSGCYPLDPFYAARDEAIRIRTLRTPARLLEEA